MSIYDATTAETTSTSTPAQDIHLSTNPPNAPASTSTPVEMSHLASQDASDLVNTRTSTSQEPHPIGPIRTDTNTAMLHSMQTTQHPPLPSDTSIPEQQVTRTNTGAIGPSSDQPIPPAKDEATTGPPLLITLLLTSGARHPFKLDSKYLAKRNVEAPSDDPFNISVYKLKELILREWREEWELKPASPSSIRLISFGKLLDDKTALKDYKFNHETPNVLHMTIKPSDFVEEEDAKGGKGGYTAGRDDGEPGRSPRCRCLVM